MSSSESRVLHFTRNVLLGADPERLIAWGRTVTVAFALLAFYLDPTQPEHFRSETRIVLASYGVFALILLLRPSRRRLDSPVHYLTHFIDTAVLGCIAYLTHELTSPFFSFLPFPLLAMAIRWGLKGAIAGAVVLEALLLAIGIPDIFDGVSELNYLIARLAYFAVFATMLGYFAAYRESSRTKLAMLANWPIGELLGERQRWLRALLDHAASVLGCTELLALWEDEEKQTAWVALWTAGHFDVRALRGDQHWAGLHRLAANIQPSHGTRVVPGGALDAIKQASGLTDGTSERPNSTVYSAAIETIRFTGICLVSDPDCRPEDASLLTEIVAGRIGAEIERFDLVSWISETARSEERSRLARDLHDSVLQDLTATSLKIRNAKRQSSTLDAQLDEIETLIVDQQRRIRYFVEEQREADEEQVQDVAAQLHREAQVLAGKWGVDVRVNSLEQVGYLPRDLVEDLLRLVGEGTANAVRHGNAGKVTIDLACHEGELVLSVADDGKGLPPDGPASGSHSIRKRLADLRGTMILHRGEQGLVVEMRIPRGARA